MPLRYAKLVPQAFNPTRKHADDAGVDVYALERVIIPPFCYKVVRTGVTFEIPAGFMLEIRPKGRNNHLIGSGIVDAGYQGEILVKVVNYSWKFIRVKQGEAIAQLIQVPVICDPVQEVYMETLLVKASERGSSGGIHSV